MLQAIDLPAITEGRGFFREVPLDIGALNTCDAFDRRQWQRIELIASPHDQRLRDRQREWQTNRELHTLTRLRFGEERTAEFLDFSDDHIHADAAASMLSHAARRTEAGL